MFDMSTPTDTKRQTKPEDTETIIIPTWLNALMISILLLFLISTVVTIKGCTEHGTRVERVPICSETQYLLIPHTVKKPTSQMTEVNQTDVSERQSLEQPVLTKENNVKITDKEETGITKAQLKKPITRALDPDLAKHLFKKKEIKKIASVSLPEDKPKLSNKNPDIWKTFANL